MVSWDEDGNNQPCCHFSNSMEQNPSCEANNYSGSQEVPCFL